MVELDNTLARRVEAGLVYAVLAMLLYYVLGYLLQYAYEQMAWLALGSRPAESWREMREIAFFAQVRGLRYFLAFLFLGVLHACIAQYVRLQAVALLVSMLVAPLVLSPLIFYITAREWSASTTWSLWAIVCAMYYWHARLRLTWHAEAAALIVVVFYVGGIVSNDFVLWEFRFERVAEEVHGAARASELTRQSRPYFAVAESVYIAAQVLFWYWLPRRMMHSIAAGTDSTLAEAQA